MNDIAEKARRVRAYTSNAVVLDLCDWILNHKCNVTGDPPADVTLQALRKAGAARVKKHRSKNGNRS